MSRTHVANVKSLAQLVVGGPRKEWYTGSLGFHIRDCTPTIYNEWISQGISKSSTIQSILYYCYIHLNSYNIVQLQSQLHI